ncbi:hypothetical protein CNR22_12975 [Sphingobacteriaceae bacterium]|nr:hypothetical protein CNR22_12975 [Sphingobacteriaceae bacterium]
MKQFALILLLFCCAVLNSQTANIDFESTPAGTYTTANAVNGWAITSQVNGTLVGCSGNTVWTAGSPEFSIVSTPIAAFPEIGNILQSPLGGTNVARLNNSISNSVTTKLSRTYSVTSSNSSFQFAFAGVWTGGNHYFCSESFFKFNITDQYGNIVSCVTQSLAPGPGNQTSNMSFSSSATAHWSNWQLRTVDLSQYINTVVTIEISCGDCQFGDHFGTLFFDADFPYVTPPISYCQGNSLGFATIVAPLGHITYSWNTGGIPYNYAWGSQQQIIYAQAVYSGQTYTLYLDQNYGCPQTIVYTFSNTPTVIDYVRTKPTCINGSAGSATVFSNASSYSWSNSTGSVISTSSVISNVAAGNYTVVALGCNATSTVVTINSGILAPTTVIQPFCGTVAYLSAPQATNYQWYHLNTAITFTAGGGNKEYIVNPAQTNDIFGVAFDGPLGCRDSLITILVSSTPGTLSVSQYTTVCQGASSAMITLSLNPVSDAPQGLNSFFITSTGTTAAFSSSLNPTASKIYTAGGLSGGGQYTISAFDGACTYTTYFTVNGFAFNFSTTPTSGTLCPGSQMASVTFTSIPSLTQYSYSWSPSTFLSSTNTRTTVIFPNVQSGSVTTIVYTVVITPSIINCPQSKTISLTFANPSTPTISAIPPLCINAAQYTVSVVPGGGSFTNGTSNAIDYSSGTFDPGLQTPGLNTFYYTNSIGPCSAVSSGSFVINPLPAISISGNTLFCEGQSTTLLASGADTYSWSNGSTTPYTTFSPSVITNYTLEGNSLITNCSNSEVITLSVVPYPQLSIAGNTLLCPGQSATLIAIGAYFYNWDNGSTSYMTVVTPTTNTTYTLTGTTSLASCSSTQAITVSTSDCNFVGLKELSLNGLISVYPNPTSGKLTIACKKDVSITLLDGLGKILLQSKINEGHNTLDLSNYNSGIYFLKINDGHYSSNLKLIKTD